MRNGTSRPASRQHGGCENEALGTIEEVVVDDGNVRLEIRIQIRPITPATVVLTSGAHGAGIAEVDADDARPGPVDRLVPHLQLSPTNFTAKSMIHRGQCPAWTKISEHAASWMFSSVLPSNRTLLLCT